MVSRGSVYEDELFFIRASVCTCACTRTERHTSRKRIYVHKIMYHAPAT